LPGPAGFVEAIARDLRRGSCVLVAFPVHAPDGFSTALRNQFLDDDLVRWAAPKPGDIVGQEPLHFLVQHYATDLAGETFVDERQLAGSGNFAGRIVCVEPVAPQDWQPWWDFLLDYTGVLRHRPTDARGLVCIVTRGVELGALPAPDIALALHAWRGFADELDLLSWLHYWTRDVTVHSPVKKRLRLRLGLELIGFDATLAPQVATKGLADLLAPTDWLVAVAQERGWLAEESPSWIRGSLDDVEDKYVSHPALLALKSNASSSLRRCIWRAQVAVLFPLIEQERTAYLERYKALVRLPFSSTSGAMIQELEDLEIGHLHHLLAKKLDHREAMRLRRLKDARNALAHLDPLEADELEALIYALSNS
jgi:hypothetical protein